MRAGAKFCRATCRAAWHAQRKAALFGDLAEALARAAALARELREGSARDGR